CKLPGFFSLHSSHLPDPAQVHLRCNGAILMVESDHWGLPPAITSLATWSASRSNTSFGSLILTPVERALAFARGASSVFLASIACLTASAPSLPPAPPRRRTSGLPKVRAPKPFVPAAAPAY